MADVLLVTTVDAAESDLSEELRRAIGDSTATVRIVAPATDVSKLDWLTNGEDDARAEARDAAHTAATAVESTSVEIDRTSHDTEAAQAVVDALRGFDADEIVVVTRPGDDVNRLEQDALASALESSGAPVRRVELPAREA
jgi:G3E family GTPase